MATKKEIKPKKMAAKTPVKANKKTTKPVVAVVEETDEEEIDIVTPKSASKKPLEIDVAEILPETDEKIDEEAPVIGAEDEESEEGLSLDEEELNPFGDKWEM